MATTMKLIAKQTLSSTAATVTFSGIPGTMTDLLCLTSARNSSTSAFFWIRFNGVSTNLSGIDMFGNGSSVVVGTNAPYARMSTSTDTSNTFGSTAIYIPNYAGSTNKSLSIDSVSENNGTTAFTNVMAGLWSSTAAITAIDLVSGSSTFAINSSFYLYGITRA